MKCAILSCNFTNFSVDTQSAVQLAEQLQLPLTQLVDNSFEAYLLTDGFLLRVLIPSLAKMPYAVDFDAESLQKRLKSLGQELLVRACGIKKYASLTLVDATAGFGRDAFILAAAGAHVTLVEKNPIVACLLANGILQLPDRYQERMHLLQEDSVEVLKNMASAPDVIYLDPMFEITRHAKVKKDLQFLQALSKKNETNNAELLALAKKIATQRVVVKRALHDHYLHDKKPSFSLKGKDTRFDVYARNKCNG